MNQHTGAILDKLFIIGFGVFALFAPPSLVKKKGSSPEAIEKKVRTLRICGGIMVACGVILLLLVLF